MYDLQQRTFIILAVVLSLLFGVYHLCFSKIRRRNDMAYFTAGGSTILIIAQCFSIKIYTNAIMADRINYRID